jgi:NADH dehydrogenase [ubiquinone] 1 alpha subcomplex assembly factor 2
MGQMEESKATMETKVARRYVYAIALSMPCGVFYQTTALTNLFVTGMDLAGNTFWELHPSMSGNARVRRVLEPISRYVRYPNYGDVQISPQWLQWLRHTRQHPPTLDEQQLDLMRQQNMKVLAARADERWRNAPSMLDRPETAQPEGTLRVEVGEGPTSNRDYPVERGVKRMDLNVEDVEDAKEKIDVQYKTPVKSREKENFGGSRHGNPGDEWQPEAWSPRKAKSKS